MGVTWDKRKAELNLRKHGVEFSLAATALDDPMSITVDDDRHDERRFVTMGMDAFGRILVVAYAYDQADCVRIISARKATLRERGQYHG